MKILVRFHPLFLIAALVASAGAQEAPQGAKNAGAQVGQVQVSTASASGNRPNKSAPTPTQPVWRTMPQAHDKDVEVVYY